MKIKSVTSLGKERIISLSEAIIECLNEHDYYAGEHERLKDRIRNLINFVGKLTEELNDKNIISKDFVEKHISYGDKIIED